MSAHDYSFDTIDGDQRIDLKDYAGNTVLVANTASACGYTPQYEGLQELWQRYRARGLVVIGVPSNDFGAQEPGTETEIQEFCATRFHVDFPMTTKQVVIGGAAHPFYKWVASTAGEDAAPKWNFHKYLIGPDGTLAGTFPSKVDPLGTELTTQIEALL
ncbi:MAG: glutathione peroxidase [Alphaproteobacteria bacterium]|nr:glutathione peroxidase [Alphaproteobacteria bacterium]